MTNLSPRLVALGLATIALVGACSSSEASEPSEPVATGPVVLLTTDVGEGWTLQAPDTWSIGGAFGGTVQEEDGCVVDVVYVSHDDTSTEVALVSPSCSADSVGRRNGEPANFGSANQILDGDDVQTSITPSGILTMATVSYMECTNECDFWGIDVGVITLDTPGDSQFPTLLIRSNDGGTTREQIEFIAQHLSHS